MNSFNLKMQRIMGSVNNKISKMINFNKNFSNQHQAKVKYLNLKNEKNITCGSSIESQLPAKRLSLSCIRNSPNHLIYH